MADRITRYTQDDATIAKIKQGREAAAMRAAKHNGLDEVFVEIEGDTYVVSGRGMKQRGLRWGDQVEVNGKVGKVVGLDDQVNTAGDAISNKNPLWGPIAGVQISMAIFAKARALHLFALGLGATAASVLFGKVRPVDRQALADYTEGPARRVQ